MLIEAKPSQLFHGTGGMVSARKDRLAFMEDTHASTDVGGQAPKVNRTAS